MFFSFLVTHLAQISNWHFPALLSTATFSSSHCHTFIYFAHWELSKVSRHVLSTVSHYLCVFLADPWKVVHLSTIISRPRLSKRAVPECSFTLLQFFCIQFQLFCFKEQFWTPICPFLLFPRLHGHRNTWCQATWRHVKDSSRNKQANPEGCSPQWFATPSLVELKLFLTLFCCWQQWAMPMLQAVEQQNKNICTTKIKHVKRNSRRRTLRSNFNALPWKWKSCHNRCGVAPIGSARRACLSVCLDEVCDHFSMWSH